MSYFLGVPECTKVEIERLGDSTVIWLWTGDDLSHVSIEGTPDVYATGFDRNPVLLENMSKVEVEAEYVPKTGPETRARVIELLSNTREGYTVEQLVTFVPGITRASSMHTVLYDLRKSGVDVRKGPSPYGGRARAFWIAS